MNLSMHNQTLLRGILAGAVVLSGASACSRSDRAGTGRDTTQSGATAVVPSDSQTSGNTPQPSAGAATQPSGDTATATAQTRTPRQRTTPSSRRAEQDTTVKSGEAAVSGYRGMGQDSVSTAASDSASTEPAPTGAASPLDSAGVTSDYALTGDTTSADSTSAGYSEMARDTSSAAGRGDTAAVAVADTTTPAESDTASIKVQMDTTQVANADTLQDNSARIRPHEDSTEVGGNAGAAPIGGTVTGIDAVSLMSRAGARCVVKDDSGDVYWDLSDSPAALNPCGTGTMTLSLVRTGEK
jgi:hypothetical protein